MRTLLEFFLVFKYIYLMTNKIGHFFIFIGHFDTLFYEVQVLAHFLLTVFYEERGKSYFSLFAIHIMKILQIFPTHL